MESDDDDDYDDDCKKSSMDEVRAEMCFWGLGRLQQLRVRARYQEWGCHPVEKGRQSAGKRSTSFSKLLVGRFGSTSLLCLFILSFSED